LRAMSAPGKYNGVLLGKLAERILSPNRLVL
jgi:hypothetical protein